MTVCNQYEDICIVIKISNFLIWCIRRGNEIWLTFLGMCVLKTTFSHLTAFVSSTTSTFNSPVRKIMAPKLHCLKIWQDLHIAVFVMFNYLLTSQSTFIKYAHEVNQLVILAATYLLNNSFQGSAIRFTRTRPWYVWPFQYVN